MTTATNALTTLLADRIAVYIDGTEPGHCVRIDDVAESSAESLCEAVASRVPDVSVHVLRAKPISARDIAAEKAIEIRNRKQRPCLLLVPAGEGHAASSLDNSFMRVPVLDVYAAAESSLLERVADDQLREVVRRNKRWLRGQHREAWAEFLAELGSESAPHSFGRNLWRVGLIPDAGPHPEDRLDRNRVAAQLISRPSRPAASIDERLTAAGLQEGPWRGSLRRFLEQRGARLANPRRWAAEIATDHPTLTFDNWLLADTVHEDLEAVEVDPFIKSDGTLDKASKLELGDDGQLIMRVPAGGSAAVVVKWHTTPPRVAAVARWLLTVVPPDDLRTPESETIGSTYVAGDKSRGTVRVAVDEDGLTEGTRFVVNVKAIGEHGESVHLTDGTPAEIDSQEFQVVAGEGAETKTRRSAAPSVPEAMLRAALDGLDDLTEDLVSWDLEGQVFGLRLGNRRAVQVRICQPIIAMQRQITAEPATGCHFTAETAYGTPLGDPVRHELDLPPALRRNRADLLTAIRARTPRDTAESVFWDPELREGARAYLAAYRRALDAAEGDARRDLLLLDTMSLAVRRRDATIHAVVTLPIHPLRLAWIAEHDDVTRAWAHALTDITPRSARGSMVDVALVAQVVPANLPFSVINSDGRVAIYAEELTFGAGLHLAPTTVDSDAAAESVFTVLGLDRAGPALKASSRMVADRLQAYEAAHEPGGTMRVLALNPGSGDMIAQALSDVVMPEEVMEGEPEEARRVELVAYTDSAAYVKPTPALLDLQVRARGREISRRSNHLLPPLSVSVRPAGELLEDPTRAHVALIQDVGPISAQLGRAVHRRPAFRDLLVPTVTRSFVEDGELVWESAPATGTTSHTNELEITAAHRVHQRAIGRVLGAVPPDPSRTTPVGASGGALAEVPTVQVRLDGESQARISTVHQRADWVIGIDRFVGVDLYEGNAAAAMSRTYILDYAPDFVEGIGDRLTVTTANRAEVERLLDNAMHELGLADVEQSVGAVLSTLTVVSGRLALRLLQETSMAREAVSLAAVVTHLRERGALEDLIVVPVDAHPEIFGAAVRGEGSARRCDLLLVRVGARSFKIECVEVKSRKEARLPQALADMIVNQLEDTRRVLETRFFATDPPRIDGDLQRARLSSLLHYYADRSADHGLISAERLGDIHRQIDRIGDTGVPAEITMRGYVISLDGAEGFKKRYGDVPFTVLTSADLGRVGFTTRLGRPAAADTPSTGHTDSPITRTTTAPEPTHDPDEPVHAVSAVAPAAPAAESTSAHNTDRPTSDVLAPALSDASRSDTGTVKESPASEAVPQAGVDRAGTATDQPHPDLGGSNPAGRDGQQGSQLEPPASDQSPGEATVQLGQDAGGAAVLWHVSTKGSPHAFIIGIPGQGKSVTTRKIISDFADAALPSLVFDFHGDMAAHPPAGAAVLNAADGLPFSPFDPDVRSGRPINTTAWEIAEVIGYVAKLGEIQRNHVYRALQAAYNESGWTGTVAGSSVPTMEAFAAAVETVESGAQGKNARARLQPLTDFGLFADNATGRFEILNEHRAGTVIDVSQLGLEEVQRFAASFILRRIYREMFSWPQDGTMKLIVVLDEAHRMARDVTLPKIMKEGRKYGVGVIVASQSADDFHADVLGNAGTKIVFRTNYPASKAVSGFLRGRNGLDLSQEIEKLDVGVAFVSTPEVARARRVYMASE